MTGGAARPMHELQERHVRARQLDFDKPKLLQAEQDFRAHVDADDPPPLVVGHRWVGDRPFCAVRGLGTQDAVCVPLKHVMAVSIGETGWR